MATPIQPTSSTIADFCKRHDISKPTFYRMQKKGKMPRTVRIGAYQRITAEDEQAWMDSLRETDAI